MLDDFHIIDLLIYIYIYTVYIYNYMYIIYICVCVLHVFQSVLKKKKLNMNLLYTSLCHKIWFFGN